jgi:hypothetical protein
MRMGLESNLDVGVLVYLKKLWFRGGNRLFDVVRIGFSGPSALVLIVFLRRIFICEPSD